MKVGGAPAAQANDIQIIEETGAPWEVQPSRFPLDERVSSNCLASLSISHEKTWTAPDKAIWLERKAIFVLKSTKVPPGGLDEF